MIKGSLSYKHTQPSSEVYHTSGFVSRVSISWSANLKLVISCGCSAATLVSCHDGHHFSSLVHSALSVVPTCCGASSWGAFPSCAFVSLGSRIVFKMYLVLPLGDDPVRYIPLYSEDFLHGLLLPRSQT